MKFTPPVPCFRNYKRQFSGILRDHSPGRPLSSYDFISRYLLTVSPLEGAECQILTPYISSYVHRRDKIFSPSYRAGPPLAIPPGISRVQGPPWGLGPPNQISENLTLIFFWPIDFRKNSPVDRGSTPIRPLKILEKSVDCNSKKMNLNISVKLI